MSREDLFGPIDPNRTGTLVTGVNRLYWEESGNAQGHPVLFLHGGPGSGTSPAHRRFFDPAFYRIILLDQRGAGRSTPYASLIDNTTPHLVADIEALRRQLKIPRWMVFGGSWGSTLALAYAEAHVEHVAGLVLRGIFLGARAEIAWFLEGMATVYPEAARRFAEFLPENERTTLLDSYYARLTDPDPLIHMPAARAWSRYEAACSTLHASSTEASGMEDRTALSLARIEAHYMKHDIFLPQGILLEQIGKLRDIPATIVQGRYDMVCPIVTADRLARAWPEAQYRIVGDAGHSAMEPGIRGALVAATEAMKTRIVW